MTVATLGLYEVVATPMEVWGKFYRAFNRRHYRIDATYDATGRVAESVAYPCP